MCDSKKFCFDDWRVFVNLTDFDCHCQVVEVLGFKLGSSKGDVISSIRKDFFYNYFNALYYFNSLDEEAAKKCLFLFLVREGICYG
jgi:hypothetical protein